jgi:hypothetical protein
LFLA